MPAPRRSGPGLQSHVLAIKIEAQRGGQGWEDKFNLLFRGPGDLTFRHGRTGYQGPEGRTLGQNLLCV